MTQTGAWPTEIRVSADKKRLVIAFDNGERHELEAEYLRVLSPSAEVQGHSAAQKQTVPGKRNVGIMKVEPVGNYAVRITFDDMHDTGIYSWDYFRKLGTRHEELWQQYLDELEEKGLSREPARMH
ncbi:gamma-butyrobetaine hydroxylase-like domain-containing protein [Tepidamorphus sp. 3E244]|uniref:gamma-butyrobetaine hydroxylase-like domain-containing protein n=1 Tax=Tepidamorphus sp. 3E244 TaxID=3385498 RepID=UPI0038FBF270